MQIASFRICTQLAETTSYDDNNYTMRFSSNCTNVLTIVLFHVSFDVFSMFHFNNVYLYLPTPPLGQDMTQGRFLSGV